MKKLLLFIVLLSSLVSVAQERNYTYIAQRNEWLAGSFRALGLPAGDGPAAFQSGQRPWAGAVYYDSTGVDAGLYVYDGAAWTAVGSGSGTVLASQGNQMSGDTVVFAGPIGTPGLFTNERTINTNRFIMHWTNGVAATSGGPSFLPSFPTNINWSPQQFISSDTVTANDLAVPSKAVPFAGVYASRQIYYADGIIRNQKMNGHNFQTLWNWKDTFSLDTRGGDYNVGFRAESMYRPRGTGRQGIRASHGTGQNNSIYYAAPALLVNTFLDNQAGNYIKVDGHLSGVNSYLIMSTTNPDTVGKFVAYTTGAFLGTGTNIGIAYDFAPGSPYVTGTFIDSSYGWFDTARVKRQHFAGRTVLGPSRGTANTWSSSDILKVLGNVNITDTVTIGTATQVSDTTGYDIVLRRRTTGGIVRIRADQLATPTLAQVTTAGNSTTNEILLNTTDQGAYNLQVGGDVWINNGRLTSSGSFFNIAAVDSLGFSTNGTQKAVIYNDGSIRGKSYGTGGITGTPTFDLQVDANGKLVEVAIGGSGANALGTYLVQTATNAPANAQIMASLPTGIVKNTTATGVQSIAVAGDFPTLNQNTTGNANTATALQTARTISVSTDATGTSASFDGTGNATIPVTLATVNSNVGSFTNASVTVDAKGRVTAAASGTSSGFNFAQITALMIIRY